MNTTKKWNFLPADEQLTAKIREDLKIHPALCRLLALRGVKDYQTAKDFFRPALSKMHDPFLMKGMDIAVSRIQQAIKREEKVMIYGDYDVDGTTSVAVVYLFLKKQFPNLPLCYYVPHRFREGYGISVQGIETASELACKLIITLDCGIKATAQTDLAKEKGIDMIICDHHLPDNNLPKATAILNPKQKDCNYPYKELSGCGIGFKLISAIAKKENIPSENVNCFLDLVATSIAADIVPITGENRILAYFGLKRANESPGKALSEFKKLAGLERDFTITDLVFLVAPRINAAGRMDDANKAISLLVEEDLEQSALKAATINQFNEKRKEEGEKMLSEALEMLKNEDSPDHLATVLFQPHWHKGIVGIVASKVMEIYYRPTIILTESNGKITGSARSVRGFNIHHAIEQCADTLEKFGGHFFAAGMTLLPENFPIFKNKFEAVVQATLPDESRYPEIQIDATLNFSDITYSFFKILNQFEPFGPGNNAPTFISKGVRDKNGECSIMKDRHIRFVVQQGNSQTLRGIGFNLADKFPVIASEQPFDMVYKLSENEWNGNKSLQLRVLDIRKSS